MMPASHESLEFNSTAIRSPTISRWPPWLLVILVILAFLPEEYGPRPYEVRLGFGRALLLTSAPVTIMAYVHLFSSGRYRFLWSDLFVPLTGLWMVLAPSIAVGWETGLIHGGAVAIDFWFAYAIMRVLPRDANDIYSLVKLICLCSAVIGVVALLDTATGRPVLHETWQVNSDLWRFGLLRARATFEHPILLGTAMAIALILARGLEVKARVITNVGCSIGLLASLSSAPLLAAIIGFALLIYGRLFTFHGKWLALMIVGGGAFGLLVLVHPAPFGFIFRHFLFNSFTGYYRLLIWQYAGETVLGSPMFGTGIAPLHWGRPDWMSTSVDSLWLVSAMSFGIPGALLIALSMISACLSPVRRTEWDQSLIGRREEQIAQSIGIVVVLVIFIGFTVHIWGICWMLLGILTGLRANLGQLSATAQSVARSQTPEGAHQAY